VAICCAVVLAQDTEVVTTEGVRLVGQLIEEDESFVTLRISGIKTPIPRDTIKNIKYGQTFEQQYTQKRQSLADQDVDGWYALAYWLFKNEYHELAKQELQAMAGRFPDDSRIRQLSSIVEAQVKLLGEPSAAEDQAPVATTKPSSNPQETEKAHPILPEQAPELLTDEQIHLIKVYEIDLNEKPKVIVPREVIDRVFEDYADHPGLPKGDRARKKIRAAPGYEQLKLIFHLRARRLYRMVRVKGDPPAIREFRGRIHQRYVLNYCATNACHGSPDVGGVLLQRIQPNGEKTVYTNFFTLQSATVGNQDVINRQVPGRSLLLQYGLDRSVAAWPHPEVPGWRAKFQNKQDKLFQLIERWVGSLWTPTPDYGIVKQSEDRPEPSASQPATAPRP